MSPICPSLSYGVILHRSVSDGIYEICQRIYMTGFSSQKIYTLKVLRLVLLTT